MIHIIFRDLRLRIRLRVNIWVLYRFFSWWVRHYVIIVFNESSIWNFELFASLVGHFLLLFLECLGIVQDVSLLFLEQFHSFSTWTRSVFSNCPMLLLVATWSLLFDILILRSKFTSFMLLYSQLLISQIDIRILFLNLISDLLSHVLSSPLLILKQLLTLSLPNVNHLLLLWIYKLIIGQVCVHRTVEVLW